jgi:hypothetical protein
VLCYEFGFHKTNFSVYIATKIVGHSGCGNCDKYLKAKRNLQCAKGVGGGRGKFPSNIFLLKEKNFDY